MDAELLRIIANLIQFGTISDTKVEQGKLLAKVKVDEDRETDFFPVASFSNSYKRKASPVRVGEQVVVFCPSGEANVGVVFRSIFNVDCKEPEGLSDTLEKVIYEDGTSFSYDTKSKELLVQSVGTVKLICVNAVITAENTTINSTTTHNGNLIVNGEIEAKSTIKAKDIKASGEISDEKGSLTNHTNNGVKRD